MLIKCKQVDKNIKLSSKNISIQLCSSTEKQGVHEFAQF